MSIQVNTNREITSYLKGLAITSVLINHFINLYFTEGYRGYANGIIALFFIVSGYGIFHSLQKNKVITLSSITIYFHNRIGRIIPLFWLSLSLSYFAVHRLCQLRNYFLIPPFCHLDQVYIFITLLFQCYLVAPFLYLCLNKIGLKKYIIINSLLMLLAYLFYINTSLRENLFPFVYRRFFLGHIFLFSFGIALPSIISRYQNKFNDKRLLYISLIFFLLAINFNRNTFEITATYIAPLLIISALSFCLCLIAINPKLPLKKIFIVLGNYSYSVYLFHLFFYKSLFKLGVIKYGWYPGIFITLILLPIFIYCCMILEKSFNRFLFYKKTSCS